MISDGKTDLFAQRNDGIYVNSYDVMIRLLDVQRQGKKRMKVSDFVRGYHWPQSETLK